MTIGILDDWSSIVSRRGRCESLDRDRIVPFGRRYLTFGPASSLEEDDARALDWNVSSPLKGPKQSPGPLFLVIRPYFLDFAGKPYIRKDNCFTASSAHRRQPIFVSQNKKKNQRHESSKSISCCRPNGSKWLHLRPGSTPSRRIFDDGIQLHQICTMAGSR